MKIERTEYGIAIIETVAEYPGVTVAFERSRKHYQAHLTFKGQTRKVTFPSSPSDSGRGSLNCRQDVRRVLRTLGAEKANG